MQTVGKRCLKPYFLQKSQKFWSIVFLFNYFSDSILFYMYRHMYSFYMCVCVFLSR